MDDSDDEELQLMTDVALLEGRLKKAGCPFDETMYSHRFLNFEQQPLAKRLKLWRFRKQLREKLLADTLSPSAASGETAAAAPTVIKQEIKLETEIKSEQTARVHGNVSKSRPIFAYIEHPGRIPPEMSPLHVAFAERSVELLRRRPKSFASDLILHWNLLWEKGEIPVPIPRSCKGHQASGRADNFFVNGYFKMGQLHLMARGELPLPIPNNADDGADADADGAGATVHRREEARAGA